MIFRAVNPFKGRTYEALRSSRKPGIFLKEEKVKTEHICKTLSLPFVHFNVSWFFIKNFSYCCANKSWTLLNFVFNLLLTIIACVIFILYLFNRTSRNCKASSTFCTTFNRMKIQNRLLQKPESMLQNPIFPATRAATSGHSLVPPLQYSYRSTFFGLDCRFISKLKKRKKKQTTTMRLNF